MIMSSSIILFAVAAWLVHFASSFVPQASRSFSSIGNIQQQQWMPRQPSISMRMSSKRTEEEVEEETLSDVDARVLQSMLREQKLDLQTEDDIRKLLKRGTVKKIPTVDTPKKDEEESEYASQVIKTITDTKLWKKVTAQASDLFESLGIWVTNKIEQDVKTVAALGIFAWDRAVRDVSRALPAASTQAKKILTLTNSSSFEEKASDPLAALNRPEDEIKDVSREILSILSGERRVGAGRGLRTAAPAGTLNAAERQRRAYQQRKKLDRMEGDITRLPGGVVDAAFELKRELKSETSKPGYKTEPIRNAIEAGIVGTGNLLRAAQQEALLAAAKRKELRRLQQAKDEEIPAILQLPSGETGAAAGGEGDDTLHVEKNVKVEQPIDAMPSTRSKSASPVKTLIAALVEERSSISARLSRCIERPAETWLRESVLGKGESAAKFADSDLRDVVTKMIVLRGEVLLEDEERDMEVIVEHLRRMRGKIEALYALAADKLSGSVADAFRDEALASEAGKVPRLIQLLQEANAQATAGSPVSNVIETNPWFADINLKQVATVTEESATPQAAAVVVDVIPEKIVTPSIASHTRTSSIEVDVIPSGRAVEIEEDVVVVRDKLPTEPGTRTVSVEVVTDDDFDAAVGVPKTVTAVTDEELEKEEKDNPLVLLTLRSLDVVFFVLEKIFITGLPRAFVLSQTALARLEAINNSGKGKEGWETIKRLSKNTKGRY